MIQFCLTNENQVIGKTKITIHLEKGEKKRKMNKQKNKITIFLKKKPVTFCNNSRKNAKSK